jgi:hypothetical protein
MKLLHISVTQDHIDKGVRCDERSCPIALAMHDAGLISPSVCAFDVGWFKRGPDPHIPNAIRTRARHARMPPPAVGFVLGFDEALPVSPIEFDLEVPE